MASTLDRIKKSKQKSDRKKLVEQDDIFITFDQLEHTLKQHKLLILTRLTPREVFDAIMSLYAFYEILDKVDKFDTEKRECRVEDNTCEEYDWSVFNPAVTSNGEKCQLCGSTSREMDTREATEVCCNCGLVTKSRFNVEQEFDKPPRSLGINESTYLVYPNGWLTRYPVAMITMQTTTLKR